MQKIETMAEDVRCLLDAAGCRQVDLVGISMGGVIALQTAVDYPDRIRKLVLVNTFARLKAAGGEPAAAREMALLHLALHPAQYCGAAGTGALRRKKIISTPEQEALRQELYNQVILSDPACLPLHHAGPGIFDLRHRLGEIHLPTLVISGEQDGTVPLANQVRLAEGIPGARHVIIPEAGHAVTVDHPQEFNQILFSFLLDT